MLSEVHTRSYWLCVLESCTLKQVGHIVMLTSGSRERKYSHLSGRGQRLIRTSLLLMERSTKRLTFTGTKVEPPCCLNTHEHIHVVLLTLFFYPLQLVCPVGGFLISSRLSFPTSKLILAVNGSSSWSSKSSFIFKACSSDWGYEGRTHIAMQTFKHIFSVIVYF